MSKIEWTEKTWNPTTGCNKVSQGCKNCYAEVMHKRLQKMAPDKYNRPFLEGAIPHEPSLMVPFKWKRPTMIFVNSMSDLFHEQIPFEFVDKVFAVMAANPQHTFQVLTKRSKRMVDYFKNRPLGVHGMIREAWVEMGFSGIAPWPISNVWIGVSVEDQKTANERIPDLMLIDAAVRFLSMEPLLGSVDLERIEMVSGFVNCLSGAEPAYKPINWVICGGESGKGSRPLAPIWGKYIRESCIDNNVPFFFKQWGEWLFESEIDSMKPGGKQGKVNEHGFIKFGKKFSGRLLDGKEHNAMP